MARTNDMKNGYKKKERSKRIEERLYKNIHDKMTDSVISEAVKILMKNPDEFHGDPVDSISSIIESYSTLPTYDFVKELIKEDIYMNEEYKKYMRYININCRHLEYQKYMSELKNKDSLKGLDDKKNKKTNVTNK